MKNWGILEERSQKENTGIFQKKRESSEMNFTNSITVNKVASRKKKLSKKKKNKKKKFQ